MNPTRGLRWQWKRYQNEDPGTVSIPTEYDGLRFIFEGYQTQVREIIKNPKTLTTQFEAISAQLGRKFIPSAPYLDWMGNFFFKNGQKKSALTFFKLYHQWYPKMNMLNKNCTISSNCDPTLNQVFRVI